MDGFNPSLNQPHRQRGWEGPHQSLLTLNEFGDL